MSKANAHKHTASQNKPVANSAENVSIIQRIAYANAARANGNVHEAIRSLMETVQAAPNSGAAYAALGSAFLEVGAQVDAEAALRVAARLIPGNPGIWMNLGMLTYQRHDLEEANNCFSVAAKLIPADERPWLGLLQAQKGQKNFDGALQTANRLIALRPLASHLLMKADILAAANRLTEAEAVFDKLLQRLPVDPASVEPWFDLLAKQGRHEELATRLLALAHGQPNCAVLAVGLARAYMLLWQYKKALEAYRRANELEPNNPSIMHGLGVACRHLGNIDEATGWFSRALRLNPDNAHTLRMHGVDYRYAYGDEAFSLLNIAATHATEHSLENQIQLYFALGKAYEDVGELGTAFANYKMAGKLQNRITRYSEDQYKARLNTLAQQLRPDTIARGAAEGHSSAKPVFILGMPRSGTSLIEQILASHPQVFGAGEPPFLAAALENLAVDGVTLIDNDKNVGNARTIYERGAEYLARIERVADGQFARIVDKMPANFRVAGLIPLIFPNAHIIHARRHPVEICISCYRIYFVGGGQEFSYDLADLGRAYRVYHEAMQFWKKTLPPGKILEVRYEDVVGDTETQTRRLINHVGLEWNDACLRFHETDRAVGSASAAQVKKPIYQSSVNRWHKYKPYLGPLLEELGPLVGEYEAELAEVRNPLRH